MFAGTHTYIQKASHGAWFAEGKRPPDASPRRLGGQGSPVGVAAAVYVESQAEIRSRARVRAWAGDGVKRERPAVWRASTQCPGLDSNQHAG